MRHLDGSDVAPLLAWAFLVFGSLYLDRILAFIGFRRETEGRFVCAHCGAASRHSWRTFEAWSEGKRKMFCARCHRRWLDDHPASLPARIMATVGRRWELGFGLAMVGVVVWDFWRR